MADHTAGVDQAFGGESHTGRPARPLWEAVKRGVFGRCPSCGEGHLFYAFTKTVERCEVCGEDMHHHRADDLPAYLVITVVGHIVVSLFLVCELMFDWSSWQHLALWVPITLAMSLALLQPAKGAVIGLQWANYMHGFGGERDGLESHPELT